MSFGDQRRTRWLLTAAVFLCVCSGAACGLFKDENLPDEAAASANVIINGGLEDGNGPWIAEPGASSGDVARSGERSLELTLGPDAAPGASGAVQFTVAGEFPEFLSGYYFAEEWPEGDNAYLEVTVAPTGTDVYTPALRYIIAGAEREPAEQPDARVIMVSRREPELRTWTHFSYPVRQAYVTRTGSAPGAWQEIAFRVQIAADGAPATQPARVFFDDLYMGSQEGNPNRLPD